MSGPVDADANADAAPPDPAPARPGPVEVLDGRGAEVGGFGVQRLLPQRIRRSIGPWCFVDVLGPGVVTGSAGLDIGPHPHIGLQTVTWLLDGAVLHRDSLGSEQLIRPGQLNLMTAGRGVAHSEETSGIHAGGLHGVQLWVAQPGETRHGPPAFEHHGDLPHAELEGAQATVIIGAFAGVRSPARRDTDHVGAEVDVRPGRAVLPLDRAHEHGLVVLAGRATIEGRDVGPGRGAYLGPGRDGVELAAGSPARLLLIGGRPFPEPLVMWWNYVARDRDEIAVAHREWTAGSARFGSVPSPLARIDVPGPPWGQSMSAAGAPN